MPIDAPKNFTVSILNIMKSSIVYFPIAYLGFLAGTSKYVFLKRMPLDALNMTLMAFKVSHLF